MMQYESIIGGADEPTLFFLAGQLVLKWLNLFGLIIVVLLLIPNIIYAVKHSGQNPGQAKRLIIILEQIGRYGCMFLMVFNIGIAGFGFSAIGLFLIYLAGNTVLLISYLIIWMLYFKKQTYKRRMALAVIPVCLFMLSGITMRHYLLVIFALIFGYAHIRITKDSAEK